MHLGLMNNFNKFPKKLDSFLKKNKSFIVFFSPMLLTKNKDLFKHINYKSLLSLPVTTDNPELEYIKKNFLKIKKIHFDYILAIGGGKTLDTAKLIKYLFFINKINKKLIAIPTLYGSGTEITSSAAYYVNSLKYAKESKEIQPNEIIYNFHLVAQAPSNFIIYAALDCLCQSMESIWSKKSNENSLKIATKGMVKSYNFLTLNIKNVNKNNLRIIAEASYLVGLAMNITRTTAPHALSYPLTAYLGIPHGLAVSLIMKHCIEKNLRSLKETKKLNIFKKIFKSNNIYEISNKYNNLLNSFNVNKKLSIGQKMINKFIKEVNIDRLKNNPVKISKSDIIEIYRKL